MLCSRSIIVSAIYLMLSAPAEIHSGDDFMISSDYSYSEQNSPAVAVGPGGKFAVVWADFRNGNGDLFGQLFDSGMVANGYNLIINDDSQGAWQFDPDMSADWYGNYYIVWKDYRNNSYPFDPDIYYQKLDSLGALGSNLNITVEPPDSSHQSPSIAATGWGKTVVAWTDLRYHNWDIFAQRLDPAGASVGVNVRVNDDYAVAPQHEPAVAMSAEGWYVIVWYDGRNGNDDIFAQKYDSAGNAIGNNFRVNDYGNDAKQKFPSVAIGGNGVVYIVWTDWRNGAYPQNPDIYGQRYDSLMNRLGPNFRINMDNNFSAQRQPRVAADRAGFACVVWSDSSSGDWNITGQMINITGELLDGNFPVNLDLNGVQYCPDVALDGRYLYSVWADNRNGDFDIYGRLHQYNDAALVSTPTLLEFSLDISDPNPDSVMVYLSNAGEGELDYQLQAQVDWIVLSKTSGTTPDSFYVGIDADTLDYGLHQGTIQLINLIHNDSSAFLPVLVTITGPLLDPQPDSLTFRALAEVGPPAGQNVTIGNSGTGSLTWSLTTTAAWITLDKASGAADEVVQVGCDISSLVDGDYEEYIIITDDEALNSPESLVVTLSLLSNLAYLSAEPDSLHLEIIWGQTGTDSLQIINLGNGVSDWSAQSEAGRLALLSSAGSDGDFVSFDIATAALDSGLCADSIIIYDSAAFNTQITVPITANVYISDTVFIPPVFTQLDKIFDVQIYLHIQNEINCGVVQLRYDTTMVIYRAIEAPSGDLEGRTLSTVDTDLTRLTIEILADTLLGPISPGQYHLGILKLKANDSLTGTTALSVLAEDSIYLETASGFVFSPILESHDITIDYSTAVDDRGRDPHPAIFSLGQNFPNPFNAGTAISFDLARGGPVRLEVYNILGQRLAVLVDGQLSAGAHCAVWDGRDDSGHETASGIYFYRIITPAFRAVKKMVYLK